MTDTTAQIINYPNSQSKIIEDGIYYILFFEDSYCEVQDVKWSFVAYSTLGKGEKMKVLIELGENATFNKEAREYGQANTIPAIAEAVVLKCMSQRILYSFYLKFRVLDHPIKTFKSKRLALAWLKNV